MNEEEVVNLLKKLAEGIVQTHIEIENLENRKKNLLESEARKHNLTVEQYIDTLSPEQKQILKRSEGKHLTFDELVSKIMSDIEQGYEQKQTR